MPAEYNLRSAIPGKYRLVINYYGYHASSIPGYVRVMTFKNFGRPGQKIEIQNISLDNQYGEIEFAEVKW
jgi:hypothetical protein